jgi:exopolysaccharide biosynthesis protein
MLHFFQKPYQWAICCAAVLALFSGYVLLDAFVIPRAGQAVEAPAVSASDVSDSTSPAASEASADTKASSTAEAVVIDPIVTETSYEDATIKITIETVYEYDTVIYIADVQVSDIASLKAAFANGTYGRNIKETTSDIAESAGAIFAINGDFYGFRDDGYVVRNGVLYRGTARSADDDEALVIDADGNFSIINESETDAAALADAWQVFSFGPALIENGGIVVDSGSEVGQSMTSNPRTAIGQISALHYLFVVSDGRTDESAGLSLLQLAQVMADRGCTVAYNLDGGGSSTMWFNGSVVNNPTDGRTMGERKVSDIVYIG